jgi:hypothetical protein
MANVETNKAMGWSCIPRKIGDKNDKHLVQAIATLLEKFINQGYIDEVFNCTKLIVLNKDVRNLPSLKTLRPIQIADITKIYFESLALNELSTAANNEQITGME